MSHTVSVSLDWRHVDGLQARVERAQLRSDGEVLIELDRQPGLFRTVARTRLAGWSDVGPPVNKPVVHVEMSRISSGGVRWWAWELIGPWPSGGDGAYARSDRLYATRARAEVDARTKADQQGWVVLSVI
jgi:hypothetical protein